MKKLFYFILAISFILFIGSINLFLKIYSNSTHILGINIVLAIYFFIILTCVLITNNKFKEIDLKNSKNFRKDLKTVFANSFFTTSIISIILACIIYGFLENILNIFNLENGVINYCLFASKIWFISSPFIGLEIAIFKYFFSLEYYKKPILIILTKLIVFFLISLIYYQSRKLNCFIYAKPLCDIAFLLYYSKICFGITLNRS